MTSPGQTTSPAVSGTTSVHRKRSHRKNNPPTASCCGLAGLVLVFLIATLSLCVSGVVLVNSVSGDRGLAYMFKMKRKRPPPRPVLAPGQCLRFILSGGGVANQRRCIRNAISMAREAGGCVLLPKPHNGVEWMETMAFPQDTCVTTNSRSECAAHALNFSESEIFWALPSTQVAIAPSARLQRAVNQFLDDYNLTSREYDCIHLRNTEPSYFHRGSPMGHERPTPDFASSFVRTAETLLVIHSGESQEILRNIENNFTGSHIIIDKRKVQGLHRHGRFDARADWIALVEMHACADAKRLLLRKGSSFSSEISLLHSQPVSQQWYDSTGVL
jgi:hypothetical protein